jgi:pSer/pThr/pTyr-binding forkhead associated (FHA) protein
MFTLTFVEPSGRKQAVPLADEERGLLVGRDASCDVILDSKEVSRRHARFFVQAGALAVEDLGAHNGIYLAGEKAEGITPIVGTPSIELGDVKVSFSGSAASARPAQAKAPAQKATAPMKSVSTAAPAQGSARAGAMAARARAAATEQAKSGKGGKPAFVPRAIAKEKFDPDAADNGVKGIGAGAALRSLAKGGTQIILPPKATVGRGTDCDLVLDDDSVSRHHAELYRDQRGLYRLKDLESANGSFIDGQRAEEGQLIPEGAKLRFGDVELLFWKPPPAGATPQSRQRTLLALIAVVILGFLGLYYLKEKKDAQRAAIDAANTTTPEDEARALDEQARSAIEHDKFEDAARYAQGALDKDPLASDPRKLLAIARREMVAAKLFADGNAKAAVGNEDDAVHFFAQIDPQSRFFARARIKAKDLSVTIVRRHGKACGAASSRDRYEEMAEECAQALDVKCQQTDIQADPWLKQLRRAEKALSRRVPWSCPAQLGPLFHELGQTAGAVDSAAGARALKQFYPDDKIREAVTLYAQGEAERALHVLSEPLVMRGKTGRLAAELSEKIRLIDGRYRAGQTALLKGDIPKVEELWGDALKADTVLLPSGVASTIGDQMRVTLAQAHGKIGDDKFANLVYSSAFDEWTRGLSFNPKDQHLLEEVQSLEKVAENILSGNPNCDQIAIAVHITHATPPSPAHQAALEASARCK